MKLKFLFFFVFFNFSVATRKKRKLSVEHIKVKQKSDLLNRLLLPMPTKNMNVEMKLTQTESRTLPIVLNSPRVEKEIEDARKQAPKAQQKPVIFVPQILMPQKERRYVLHHNMPRDDYTTQMVQRTNKYYQKWMIENPFWDGAVTQNLFKVDKVPFLV